MRSAAAWRDRPATAEHTESYNTPPMSGFVEALRAYREGALSRESLLTEVERQLAERQLDAVALLKLLNEEHARLRLPDNLHSAIAARILHWRDPRPAAVLPDQPNVTRLPAHDGTETDRTSVV